MHHHHRHPHRSKNHVVRVWWMLVSLLLLVEIVLVVVPKFTTITTTTMTIHTVTAFSISNHNQNIRKQRIKTLPYRTNDPIDVERSILLIPSNNSPPTKTKKITSKSSPSTSNGPTKYQFVIGTDESGTGCIAGPIIVVSCCILPLYKSILPTKTSSSSSSSLSGYTPYPKVMDCKALSAHDCSQIYHHVQQHPDIYAYTVTYIYPNDMIMNHHHNNTSGTGSSSVNTSIPKLITNAMAHSIEQLIDGHFISTIDTETTMTTMSPPPPQNQPSSSDAFAKRTLVSNVYSIVDGHRSIPPTAFQKYTITSRPYVSGDEYVYTIALASCIARHLHETYMQEVLHVRYPQYQFHIHGGYPTVQHLQAIHTFGVITTLNTATTTNDTTNTTIFTTTTTMHNDTGVHRLSCQPIQKLMSSLVPPNIPPPPPPPLMKVSNAPVTMSATTTTTATMSRQAFIGSSIGSLFVVPTITLPQASNAMYIDTTNGISYPNIGEIESAVPIDWSKVDNPFRGDGIDTPSLFTRLDTTDDTIFYDAPRFVEHIDDAAVQTITQYIDNIFVSLSKNHNDTPNGISPTTTTPSNAISGLDLCASWTSHISIDRLRSLNCQPNLVGLGMNEKELRANTALTEYVIQDLNNNAHPTLPFPSNTFDVVLCQLSIDYLIHPFDVCCEVARVLKNTTGRVYMFFSNRSFLSKAVAVWTGKDDIDHAFIVASYLYYCNEMVHMNQHGSSKPLTGSPLSLFTNIQAHDLSKRTKSGRVIGDPLYVVSATKAPM